MDSEGDAVDSAVGLRLIVLETSILHKELCLAVLDAYGETQFGRDVAPVGSETPRIRLKEMGVSKVHATVFWDKTRREWAVVDMGSKHGTFVQSGDGERVRLSPPRVASIPRGLHHLDRLMIGSTTFLCHMHADRTPCAECTSTGQGVIPLFAAPKEGERAEKRLPPAPQGGDAKKALTTLKRTLLSRLAPSSPTRSASYVDRSARRRAMHPGSPFDSPGVQGSRNSSPGPATSVDAPPNVGLQLLMKQGWEPGTGLGVDGEGALEPVEVRARQHRAGLGSR